MFSFLKQSSVLILSSSLAFLWELSPLSGYNIHFLALIVLFYFATLTLKKNKPKDGFFLGGSIDIFLLNAAILLLIFATGGINSGLFFLLYFLAFGIVFVFQAEVVFVSLIAIASVFLLEAIKTDVMGHFLKLASLFLIYPIAYFFGRVYRESDKVTETARQIGMEIERDTAVITPKDQTEQEALKDIQKQAEKLQKEP